MIDEAEAVPLRADDPPRRGIMSLESVTKELARQFAIWADSREVDPISMGEFRAETFINEYVFPLVAAREAEAWDAGVAWIVTAHAEWLISIRAARCARKLGDTELPGWAP